MKQENKEFLDANRQHWIAWERAQIVVQLDMHVRSELLRIAREEFNVMYNANLWCSSCVIDMLKYVYTQYDKYLLSQESKQE
jgi:hypothetical protein